MSDAYAVNLEQAYPALVVALSGVNDANAFLRVSFTNLQGSYASFGSLGIDLEDLADAITTYLGGLPDIYSAVAQKADVVLTSL